MLAAGLVPVGAQVDETLELGHRQARIEADLPGQGGPFFLQPLDVRFGVLNLKPDSFRDCRPCLLQCQLVQPNLDDVAQVPTNAVFIPSRRQREASFTEAAHGRIRWRRRRGPRSAGQEQREAESNQGRHGPRERDRRALNEGGNGDERDGGRGQPGDDPPKLRRCRHPARTGGVSGQPGPQRLGGVAQSFHVRRLGRLSGQGKLLVQLAAALLRGNQRSCDLLGASEGIGIEPRRRACGIEVGKHIAQRGARVGHGGSGGFAFDGLPVELPQPLLGGSHFLGCRGRLRKPGSLESGLGGLEIALPVPQLFIQSQDSFLVLLQLLELIASQAIHIRRKALECRLPVLLRVDGIGQPQRLFQVFAPDAGRRCRVNPLFKRGQLRFLPLQADIFVFHAPARPSRVGQSPCFVNGEPPPDLDPGLAQVEVAVQLAPQTLGQRPVVGVAVVEQILDGQAKQPDPVSAGEWRSRYDLAVSAPDNLVAVAGDLPASSAALEFRFQGQSRRVGRVARQKVLERAGQAALADGIRTGDDVDSGIRRLERESGLDAGQSVNRKAAQMHQSASRRSDTWSSSRSSARYPACRNHATGSGASPSAARPRQTAFAD